MDQNDNKIAHTQGDDTTDNAPHKTDAPTDDSNNTITLEIVRHGKLFGLLKSPRDLWKMFYFLFALVIIIVMALGVAVVILKPFFPYNTITTSLYGNTTLRSEDKDVTYWLFNTAELWANSGIEVKEGDVLTIRASGASHTAVHHLAKDAADNTSLRTHWVHTDGSDKLSDTYRDRYRREFRIAPGENEGVLLMQVIPDNEKDSLMLYSDGRDKKRNGCIYVIGKERQNLVIKQNGILYFAVNDVALTDRVIDEMYHRTIQEYNNSESSEIKEKSKVDDALVNSLLNTTDFNGAKELLRNTPFTPGNESLKALNDVIKETYDFAGYPESEITGEDAESWRNHPLINEILYYKHKKFHNAWFVDNLGSFLIVIERTKH